MRKYWVYYKTGMAQVMAYRGSLLVWLVCNFISLATGVAVWLSVSNRGVLGGYTISQLITYYVLGIFIGWTINWNPFPGTKKEIKSGSIAATLVKPVSFLGQRAMWEASWRSVSMVFGLGGTLVAGFVLAEHISLPNIGSNLFLLGISFVLATSLQFMLGMCLALLAFWFTEIEGLASMRWIALEVLGGMAIPLGFIPQSFVLMVKLLPFRYMYSFPMEIIFAKVSGADLFKGLILQTIWLAIFIVIYRLMWERGLKAYVSIGQ